MRTIEWALITTLLAAPAQAQFGSSRAGAEALRTMANDPDGFCRASTGASILTGNGVRVSKIETGIADYFSGSEVLVEAKRLVAADKQTKSDAETLAGTADPLERLMDRVRNDTSTEDRLAEERRHRAEVLGQPYAASREPMSVAMSETKAVRFDQQSSILHCRSEATLDDALWILVTWDVGFGSPTADAYHAEAGWYVRNIETPVSSIEFAQANPDSVLVVLSKDARLPLEQARAKVQIDAANLAEQRTARRTEQARAAAYANSPAGRADATRRRAQEAANTRALSAEYRRLGLACQNHGGTWGVAVWSHTIMPIPPGQVPTELARMSLGCYHL